MKRDSVFYHSPKVLETPDEIYTELIWSVPDIQNKVVVLVEGHIDKAIYGSMLQSDTGEKCYVYTIESVKNNKGKILKIMEKASERKEIAQSKFIGIVDSDFNALEGKKRSIDGLFYTDTHDAETMLLSMGALERMLKELLKEGEIKEDLRQRMLENGKVSTLSELIVRETYGHGILRLHLYRQGIHDEGVKRFIQLNIECIDIVTGCIREKFVIRNLLNAFSAYQDTKDASVEHIIDEKKHISAKLKENPAFDYWDVVNGHDVVSMIRLLLNYGLYPGRTFNNMLREYHIIHKLLRSIKFQDLLKTELRNSLIRWQEGRGINIVVEDAKSFKKRLDKRMVDIGYV